MFRFLLPFALMALTVGQFVRPLVFRPNPPNPQNSFFFEQRPMRLCTYTDISFAKCLHTVQAAESQSIDLEMECVRKESRENCIQSVETGSSDMVVLTGHGYKEARKSGLRPYLFAKDNESNLYIAVAPSNITFIGVQESPILFDQSNHRAFHAATFFNLRMGHDVCSFATKASLTSYINIVESANYVPNSDEILICPNRLPGQFENYKRCNIEAGLQRAVFIRSNLARKQQDDIRQIFETIQKYFGHNSSASDLDGRSGQTFNFFDTFQGQNDVIFKKNTILFDLIPTYRNGVDERLYNHLHCNKDDQPHDPRVLL